MHVEHFEEAERRRADLAKGLASNDLDEVLRLAKNFEEDTCFHASSALYKRAEELRARQGSPDSAIAVPRPKPTLWQRFQGRFAGAAFRPELVIPLPPGTTKG